MTIGQAAYAFISLLLVLVVIFTLWYLLWKFVLEKNPLIRDFFDLDQKLPVLPKKKL
jgi:flagellar biogenesis protein FliO